MKLNFEIVEKDNIPDFRKEEMFRLLDRHYDNVRHADFMADLSEKDRVIFLYTPDEKRLAGFSTQLTLFPNTGEAPENTLVIFSGDTIIAQEYWGSVALPLAFLKLVKDIRNQYPEKHIYWMLISKGLRTYKFLSVFLKEYYPHPELQTPPTIEKMMHYLGKLKFGNKYNPDKGIIEAPAGSQYLKPQFQPAENLQNNIARFFYEKNPGYYKGDELLCLSELTESNLHPFVKRLISQLSEL